MAAFPLFLRSHLHFSYIFGAPHGQNLGSRLLDLVRSDAQLLQLLARADVRRKSRPVDFKAGLLPCIILTETKGQLIEGQKELFQLIQPQNFRTA